MRKKQNFKILLFLLLGIIIVSCVYEKDYVESHNHSTKYKLYEKKFEELMTDSKFIKSFESLPKKKKIITSSIMGRTVMEDEYGFIISDLPAKVIDDGSKISYTFLITRDSIYSNVFENLIVQTDSLNITNAYIIKYNLINDISLSAHQSFEFQSTKQITPIVYNNQNSETGKEALPGCTTVYTLMCTQTNQGTVGPIHNANENCILYAGPGAQFLSVQSEIVCTTSGGSSSSTGIDNNTSGTGTQTTGTGGGTYSDIVTSPVFEPCETCPEFDENNPCDKIKNGTNSAAYKQKFKALTNNYDAATETGFSLVGNNYVNGTAVGSTSILVSTNSKNMTHVHNNKPKFYENTTIPYDGAIKILSTGDITDVLIPMQSNNTNPTDTFVAMLSNEGIYSISILEPITWTTDLAIKFEEFENDYKNFSQYIVDNYTTMNVDDRKDYLEKYFLLALKRIGLENKIGLFEGEVENVNSTDINNYNIKWTRKKLRKVFLGYKVDPEPCN